LDATVLVHYHGKLLNGVVFDSSLDRGEPIKFPLKNVIKGWQEGVSMMKIGGKATLICPPDLAYGDSGSPPVIAPGATLVFDVELLDVL
jgi:FKBP-type peptidyl-prolyl cis-trans isomerase FkpA/FKBP-type peptidyl-prolyl cis-trans isomerase FklB